MTQNSYKDLHERFMQNHNGTTPLETVWVITPTAVTVVLTNCVAVFATRILQYQTLLVEFCIMVLPLVFHATLLSEYIAQSLSVLVFAGAIFILAIAMLSKKGHALSWSHISNSFDIKLLITNFRGIVNLITAICILAVDFRSFPRRFAKTETYGWGLMDTGVGLFVIANGLVDPEARGVPSSMKTTLRGCVPMLLLGFFRWGSILWLQYQQHITEYGVHWNFFITLAVTRVASTALLKLSNRPISLAALCLMSHQALLVNGLAEWVLGNAPRDNLFAANREGCCSLLGYIALHQAGVALGRWLQSSPPKRGGKPLLLGMTAIAAMMWLVAIATGPPSRRLANLSYVAWILGYSCTLLALLLGAQVVSLTLATLSGRPAYSPSLLAAINFNSLPFFLLANLLTGVINMSVHTLYVAPRGSVLIITMYMYLVCFTVNRLFISRMKIKIW